MAHIDLSNPVDSLNSFIRARVSATPEDVVFWFAGNVYSFVEGERSRHLFQFEGYNIGKSRKVDGGWQMLTKECVFYKDPVTGEILESWTNPWTQQTVEVVHVLNDPVNQHLMLESPRGPWKLPYTELGDDVYFSTDVFLKYPSPLPQSKYPKYARGEEYEAAELFQFFVKRSDLENDDMPSVPAQCSWARIGPWLPWMEMADRPGLVVYNCRGKKLIGGYTELPASIRAYVEAKYPQYRHAPDEITGPNETSWTYFQKLLAARAS